VRAWHHWHVCARNGFAIDRTRRVGSRTDVDCRSHHRSNGHCSSALGDPHAVKSRLVPAPPTSWGEVASASVEEIQSNLCNECTLAQTLLTSDYQSPECASGKMSTLSARETADGHSRRLQMGVDTAGEGGVSLRCCSAAGSARCQVNLRLFGCMTDSAVCQVGCFRGCSCTFCVCCGACNTSTSSRPLHL
jgi:hypothetical protein